ncbi:MAG: NAD-dependent epimerase/dehydratase family protein [Bacteroidia bacterium]|nr:NAD-dependent epimerase/dehydratase family protein [Bacteroidia bacterium]
MKVTLIGGSGFVGTRLFNLLEESGEYHLNNVDLVQSHFFQQYTTIGDVRKQDQMNKELADTDFVVLLAAQHRDDVKPHSLYYDTNVEGMKVTLQAMENNGIKNLIFFSSVAVYGLNRENPNENSIKDPFNHYGKSKWQAEQVLQEWYKTHNDWVISVLRPTVIFGERNRGNVYNLLKQISSGRFIMVGNGMNKKSMAYVGNVVAFVKHLIDDRKQGYEEYNYIDKPDYNMNDLVSLVSSVLGKHIPSIHVPYCIGKFIGYCFDLLAFITRKKLTVSSVRIEKFCATTEFCADKVKNTGFKPPFTLKEGLSKTLMFEFVGKNNKDGHVFESE